MSRHQDRTGLNRPEPISEYYKSIGRHYVKAGKYSFEVDNHKPNISGGRLGVGIRAEFCDCHRCFFDKKPCGRPSSIVLDLYQREDSGYHLIGELRARDIDIYIALFQAIKKEIKANKNIKYESTGPKDFIMTI